MKKAIVLLPTYNERDNIGKFIQEVFDQTKDVKNWSIEILVADSHSPDGTIDIVKDLAKKDKRIHYIETGRGLGVGLIEGHKYSLTHFKPDALVQLDADGQVSADVIPKMLNGLDEGYSLMIGSRFVEGGKNLLAPSRKFFSWASSMVCRVIMGPMDIKEYSNSARAFTPELFRKVDLNIVPWKEQTFIIQPAFLYAATQAGAKYKEVPLVFKNRAEGYSKMKIFNYSYDVFTYAIGARLHQWGIPIDFFRVTRRAKTIVKFGLVGFVGTVVDFIFYKIFINSFMIPPATSKGISSEIAIVNNFLLNNYWTFRYRKTKSSFWQKFLTFNLVSLGGLAISVLIVKFLHSVYGDGFAQFLGLRLAYNNFYFFATIPPVLVWNFTINHFVTFRHRED